VYPQRTLVLDCGASRTALGSFTRRGCRLYLEAFAVVPLGPDSGPTDPWLEETRAALHDLRARLPSAAGPAVLILPAHLTLTRMLAIPRVAAAQRARIIGFEAAQAVPFALTDVVWDHLVAGRQGTDVLLAAARLDAVEPLCAAAQAAGFEPQFLLPSALATLAGFRIAHPAPAQPVLILNLGARSTTLLLAGPQGFAARTLPFGGQLNPPSVPGSINPWTGTAPWVSATPWTSELARTMPTPPADGDLLAARLAQEITRTVGHFCDQDGMDAPVRVYLTGGGSRIASLAEALTVRLQLPVGWLDALGAIENDCGESRVDSAANALSMADLIGGAAARLLPHQPLLDLQPPSRRRQQAYRRRRPWLIAAAVFALAALVLPMVHLRRLAREAQRKTAAIERALVPLRERDTRNRANLRQIEELRRQVLALQGVYDRRASWVEFLADLQDRLAGVEDVWLEKLQVMPGTPVKLAISGRLLDRARPPDGTGPLTPNRIQSLLTGLGQSAFIAAVEDERFDTRQPGILKFDCVLVLDSRHPL